MFKFVIATIVSLAVLTTILLLLHKIAKDAKDDGAVYYGHLSELNN